MLSESKPDIEVNLTNCDREQIHIPGSVQSFGALVAIDAAQVVTRVSDNISKWIALEPEKIIGRNISELFEPDDITQLLDTSCSTWGAKHLTVKSTGAKLSALCRVSTNEVYFDLLKNADDERRVKYSSTVSELTKKLSGTNSENAVAQLLADTVRELSKFDRVKVYKFDEDWHGEVIAEAKSDSVPSYLGLHFPQSDIPKQARELYIRNRVRVIGDVNDPQSPLLEPAGMKPLDLSFSFVRSVSPIHLQYLRNMMVSSSMSLSLFQNRAFWGLIACHHTTPRTFTFDEADFYDSISEIGSNRLTDLYRIADATQKSEYLQSVKQIVDSLRKSKNVQRLVDGDPSLVDLIYSTGAIVVIDGKRVAAQNAVPDQDSLTPLVAWLERGNQDVVSYDDMPQRYSQDIGSYACGMLAARIPEIPQSWLIWFRFEVAKEVRWAGDPFKPEEETKYGKRLYPRTSFELWKQIKKGHSLPWLEHERAAAEALASSLSASALTWE